jgi:hypothetical protein
MTAKLLAALIAVESGGNDHARGRHGELGPLQIQPAVVADVRRITGRRYAWGSMTNRVLASEVVQAYLGHYATEARIGRPVTDQDRARIWNGGPDGWRRRRTAAYWNRVVAAMRRMDREAVAQERVVAVKISPRQ